VKSKAAGFARDTGGTALNYAPEAMVHPFAVAVNVRARSEGLIVSISGVTLNAATQMKKIERGRGAIEIESTTLTPGAAFNATLGVIGGRWAYTAANGRVIQSDVKADDGWHQLVVSHYTARGETLFFVDGKLAGTTAERLETKGFAFGGALTMAREAQQVIDFKDLLIYRSALNADEVAALHTGTLLQASLDVYAPLADAKFERALGVENRAQSLSVVKATSNLQHVEK
jgi:hypothetical protein